jgi:carbamoyl-phosphate synthase large subunit
MDCHVVFISLRKLDRDDLVELGKRLASQGFSLVATRSNKDALVEAGLECETVNKVSEGSPHIVDMIKNDQIDLIINSTEDTQGAEDAAEIRQQALVHKVVCTTTVAAAFAILDGLKAHDKISVRTIQSLNN